jgi:GT2 family glycosyltransferase
VSAASASSVDVVVVTRDTRELTLRCVASVLAEARDPTLRLSCAVVDNASSDGTAEALSARHPAVRVLRNPVNRGYANACNQGLHGGSGEYVLVLNSDVIGRPGAIAALIGFLRRSPAHVAAGGRLVDPGTDRVQRGHAVRAFPRLLAQMAQMLGLERHWPSNPISRRYLMLDLDYERTQDVEQPAGSCLACRRADFDAIGGFDEAFFYWYEDVDLVRRLHERGRVAYVHDAVFEHVGGTTFAQWGRPSAILTWYPSLFRYFAKHHPRREQLALRALAALLCAIRAAINAPLDRERARACLTVAAVAAGLTSSSPPLPRPR